MQKQLAWTQTSYESVLLVLNTALVKKKKILKSKDMPV